MMENSTCMSPTTCRLVPLTECALTSLLVLSAHGGLQHLPMKLACSSNTNEPHSNNGMPTTLGASQTCDWSTTAAQYIGKRPLRSIFGVFYYCWSLVASPGSSSSSSTLSKDGGGSKASSTVRPRSAGSPPLASVQQVPQQPQTLSTTNIRVIALDILANLVAHNPLLMELSLDVLKTLHHQQVEKRKIAGGGGGEMDEEFLSATSRFVSSCLCAHVLHQPITCPLLWMEHVVQLQSNEQNLDKASQLRRVYVGNERILDYLQTLYNTLITDVETAGVKTLTNLSEVTIDILTAFNATPERAATTMVNFFLYTFTCQWLQRFYVLPYPANKKDALVACLDPNENQTMLVFIAYISYHLTTPSLRSQADALCTAAFRACIFMYIHLSVEERSRIAHKLISMCTFPKEYGEWYNVHGTSNNAVTNFHSCQILCALCEFVHCAELAYPLLALYFLNAADELEECSLQWKWSSSRGNNANFHYHTCCHLLQHLRTLSMPCLGEVNTGLPSSAAPTLTTTSSTLNSTGTTSENMYPSDSSSRSTSGDEEEHHYSDNADSSADSRIGEEESEEVDNGSKQRRHAAGNQHSSNARPSFGGAGVGGVTNSGRRVNALLSLHMHVLMFCYHPEENISHTMIKVMKSLTAVFGTDELPPGGVGLLLHNILHYMRTQRQSRPLLHMALSAFRQIVALEQPRLSKADWREHGATLLAILTEVKRCIKYFHQPEAQRESLMAREEEDSVNNGSGSMTSISFLLALSEDVTRAIHMLFVNAPSNRLKVSYVMCLCEWLLSDLGVLLRTATKYLRSVFDLNYTNTQLLNTAWLASPAATLMSWRSSVSTALSSSQDCTLSSSSRDSLMGPHVHPPLFSSTQLRRLLESLCYAVALAETEAAATCNSAASQQTQQQQQDTDDRGRVSAAFSEGEAVSEVTLGENGGGEKKPKRLLVTDIGICGREALLTSVEHMSSGSSVESLVVPLVDYVRSPDNRYHRQLATEFIIRACQCETRGLAASSGKLLAALLHGILSPVECEAKLMSRAIALLMPHAKDAALQRIFSRVRQWYLEYEPTDARYERAALCLMRATCHACPMILRAHYKQCVPLVFVAMARSATSKERGATRAPTSTVTTVRGNKGAATPSTGADFTLRLQWETVWREMLNDASSCVQLHFTDILAFIEDCLRFRKHMARCEQASFALAALSNEEYFTHEHQAKAFYQMIFTVFSEEVHLWERKTLLFRSIYCFTSTRIAKRMEGNFDSVDKQCIEILKFEAARSEPESVALLNHNIEAMYMLAYTAEVLAMDVFPEAWPSVKRALAIAIQRDQELALQLSQDSNITTFEESILAVIPLLWPCHSVESQKRYLQEILNLLCDKVERPHWGRRLYALNALVEILKKLLCVELLHSPAMEATVLRFFHVLQTCANEAKSPNLRFQILNCVDLMLPGILMKFRNEVETMLKSYEDSPLMDDTFASRIAMLREQINKLDSAHVTITNV